MDASRSVPSCATNISGSQNMRLESFPAAFQWTGGFRPVVSFETRGPFVANLPSGQRTAQELEYHSFEVTRAKSGTKGMASPQ